MGEHIASDRDAMRCFGKYMQVDGPYTMVTAGFLLQLLRENWEGKEPQLAAYCDRIQKHGMHLKAAGTDTGCLLDLACCHPEPGIVLRELLHPNPPVQKPPRNLKRNRNVKDYGIHPDVAITFLLELPIPEDHRALLHCLHAEIQLDGDAEPYAIELKSLAEGCLTPLAQESSEVWSAWSGVLQSNDVVDLIAEITTVSMPPFPPQFVNYLKKHGMNVGSDGETASQPIPGNKEKPERPSLIFTGKHQKCVLSGRYRWELIADGNTYWATPSEYMRTLTFAVARKLDNDGHGGIDKLEPKVAGHDMSEIFGNKYPKSIDRFSEQAKQALVKSGRPQKLCIICDDDGRLILNWEAKHIHIEQLRIQCMRRKYDFDTGVQRLIQLYDSQHHSA